MYECRVDYSDMLSSYYIINLLVARLHNNKSGVHATHVHINI